MHQFHEYVPESDIWAIHDNAHADDYELREWAYGEHHWSIMAQLEYEGVICPIHAAMNSHCN
jgi:hypothetical protein